MADYALGQIVPLTFIVLDVSEDLVAPGGASLTIRLPDGSLIYPVLSNPEVGVYTYNYLSQVLGAHLATFTTTGAYAGTVTQGFTVGTTAAVPSLPTDDTFSSMVDEVIVSLQGYGVVGDQVCTLIEDIDSTATLVKLDAADMISRGVIEIDQELMYVVSSDSGGKASVRPWGRGWKGTNKTPHNAGAAVFISPTFPRSIVAREVNNTITSVYPDLFAVRTFDFTFSAVNLQYGLPSDTDRIISVEWKWNQIDGWAKVNSWEMINSASISDFPSGKALSIGEPLWPSATIHVTYMTQPMKLANDSDLFTVSGLPASSRDVIVYGAASRLLPWLDSGRLPVDTVSSDAQDTQRQLGSAINVAKELRSLYTKRLQQERQELLIRYPVPIHKVRW